MDNHLLTFNLRVPVGLQVVSHLISENNTLEQLLLILSSVIGGCKFDQYRKEIEAFTLGPLQGVGRAELQHALTVYAASVSDQLLANFIPEMTRLLGLVRIFLHEESGLI
jgi:hypothetical protein